jgi:membrane-associated phospholipid phosphatase
MPSSHAMITVGMLVWLVLEVVLNRRTGKQSRGPCVVALLALLLPIVPARIALGDHSLLQVMVGGTIGGVLGGLHFILQRNGSLPAMATWAADKHQP